MSCRRYRGLLSRYFDDALSRREQDDLLSHLDECADCAKALAEYRRDVALLGRLPTSEPSPALRESVLASLGSQTNGRPVWRLVATAAALLLLVVGAVMYRGRVPLLGTAPQASLATPEMTPVTQGIYAGDLEGREVLEALQRSLPEEGRPLLPSYLPRGTRVENVSLTREGEAGELSTVDMSFRISDGQLIRVRQAPGSTRPLLSRSPAQRLVIDGREWRYLPRPARESQDAAGNLLIGEVNGTRLELESSLPLEDLVKVAESLR